MDWGLIVLSLVGGLVSAGFLWIYLRSEADRRSRRGDRS